MSRLLPISEMILWSEIAQVHITIIKNVLTNKVV